MSATTFGKYELVSKLASGGMAVTYKALMLGAMGVKKPVVLKLIHPHLAEEAEFVDMFIEEAKLSATLTHSNIAQVFDFGEVDGRYFIAMELVDGQSLSHLLKRAKRKGHQFLPVPLAVLVTVEMCEALYYAHTRTDETSQPLNLVHRDVSPENVLISWQGEVKLVDFGIAKSTMTGKQTATGMVKGKYPYFSPEQSRADRTMDARTDVYAASVVLYEMLCARRPYEGEFVEVMRQLLTGDFPLPSSLNPEVPAELEQLILKGLALDRNARFKTAREMGQALNGLTHSLYPDVHRSDLQSLMSVLFEEDLKAAGRTAEIRDGFRDLLNGKPSLATDEAAAADKTPPGARPKLATGKQKALSSRHPAVVPSPVPSKPGGRTGTSGQNLAHVPGARTGASGQHAAHAPGARTGTSGKSLPHVPATRVSTSGQSAAHVPATRAEAVPPDSPGEEDEPTTLPSNVKMTGAQQETALSLDSPEKAEARARAVKIIAGSAFVLFVAIAVLAIVFGGKKEQVDTSPKTPVWATSVPPGADVAIDGRPQGKAPMDGMLSEGTYTFGMTLAGYRPWTKRVTVGGGRQIHVEAQLVPEAGDQPVEPVIPTLAHQPVQPITAEAAPDASVAAVEADPIKHVYTWPMRQFSVWPEAHTLPLGQYGTFELELDPDTTYFLSSNGSVDLGPKLGKTSAVIYYLEGEKVDPKDRFGFISPSAHSVKGASKLYAWLFDDDPKDNKGKLTFTIFISKYIPERYATFNPEEHVITPDATDVLKVEGLLPDHRYRIVFRPDSPRVMGAPAQQVLCIHESPRPKPIQKTYVWYPIKYLGEITGVTGLTCMYLAWNSTGMGGLLEVDIDDVAELHDRKKKK